MPSTRHELVSCRRSRSPGCCQAPMTGPMWPACRSTDWELLPFGDNHTASSRGCGGQCRMTDPCPGSPRMSLKNQWWRSSLWSQHAAARVRRSGLVAVRRGVGCCGNVERQLWCCACGHRARGRWRGHRPKAILINHV